MRAEILSLLKSLQKTHWMAVILITHDLTVVSQVSDTVVVMRQGEVVQRGRTREVFANPQQPCAKHLMASEPMGLPDPQPPDAEPVLSGKTIGVTFHLQAGGFFGPKLFELRAVNDVTATIRRGETLGIVGDSGSGKTSLGMAMIRRGLFHRGKITFHGDRIDHLSRKQLQPYRTRMQVMFQDPFSSLNPRTNIRQILEEGLVVNNIGASAKDRDGILRQALDDVHMPRSALGRFPHESSGGPRQRLAIAGAIALSPEFIPLDEPTSALDLSIQTPIIDLPRELRRKRDLIHLFISHDLKVMRALCHNVIVMQHGQVMERGPTEEVLVNLQNDYTKRLVAAAFQVVA